VIRDHCDDKNCEHLFCVDQNRQRRRMDIRDKFEAGRAGRDVIYSVFTVPPRRRLAAAERVTLRPRKKPDGSLEPRVVWRWQLWLAELLEGLKFWFGLEYAVERSDPTGKDGEAWHPHLNLLWVTEDGSGYIAHDKLEALKAEWKSIVGEHPENPINVYCQYASEEMPHKRDKWYSYMGRTWPGWEVDFPYHLRVKWLGHPAKRPDREHDATCPKCGLLRILFRVGNLAEAMALAARGYAALEGEHDAKLAAFRRSRRTEGIETDVTELVRSGRVGFG